MQGLATCAAHLVLLLLILLAVPHFETIYSSTSGLAQRLPEYPTDRDSPSRKALGPLGRKTSVACPTNVVVHTTTGFAEVMMVLFSGLYHGVAACQAEFGGLVPGGRRSMLRRRNIEDGIKSYMVFKQ